MRSQIRFDHLVDYVCANFYDSLKMVFLFLLNFFAQGNRITRGNRILVGF